MFGAFLETVGGWFDKQFMVAYWSPTFVGFGLVLVLGIPFGYAEAFRPWLAPIKDQQVTLAQVLLAVSSLIVVTVVAYLLQALTPSVVRAYEGYWPRWLGPIARTLSNWQQAKCDNARRTHKDISKNRDSNGNIPLDKLELYQREKRRDYYGCPQSNATPVRPTHLGNVLSAAEDYSRWMYSLDSVLWWPRLAPLFPSAFRDQVVVTLTPMLALLNLATIFLIVGIGESAVLAVGSLAGYWTLRQPWWTLAILVVAGIVLAYGAYRSAITQAFAYADTIRVGFDLYRHDLLKQLDVALPPNLVAERKLWMSLSRRIYFNLPHLLDREDIRGTSRGIAYSYSEAASADASSPSAPDSATESVEDPADGPTAPSQD